MSKKLIISNRQAKALIFSDETTEQFDEIVMNSDFAWGMSNLVDEFGSKKI